MLKNKIGSKLIITSETVKCTVHIQKANLVFASLESNQGLYIYLPVFQTAADFSHCLRTKTFLEVCRLCHFLFPVPVQNIHH